MAKHKPTNNDSMIGWTEKTQWTAKGENALEEVGHLCSKAGVDWPEDGEVEKRAFPHSIEDVSFRDRES